MTLTWIPGHMGFDGNEKADELARKGTENTFCGPEPCVALTKDTINAALEGYKKWRHMSEWRSRIGLKHSKEFLGNCSINHNKIWRLKRNQLSQIVGLYTGHYGTGEHLHRMQLIENPICRFCRSEPESMKHLMCECDSLARKRMSTLGLSYPEPEDYRRLCTASVIKLLDMIECRLSQ